jgi:hypothetical protein
MKKQLIVVVAVLLISVGLCGCFGLNQEDELSGLGYSNTEFGFGLNPPAGWTKDTSGTLGLIVIFYAPIDDDFAENINAVSDILPSGTSLSSYVDTTIDYLNDYLTDYNLISSNPRTVNGMNAYEYEYNYTQVIYNIKAKQVIVEKNSKIIALTYTAEIDDYDTYSSEFEQCVNSLKIV